MLATKSGGPAELVSTGEREEWTFEEPSESLPTGTASSKRLGQWKKTGGIPYLMECKSGGMLVGCGGLAEVLNADEFLLLGPSASRSGGTANTFDFWPAAFGGSRVLPTNEPVWASYGTGKAAFVVSLVSALLGPVMPTGARRLPRDQEDRLARLSGLAEGWDTYGGRRITKQAVRKAREALFRIDSEKTWKKVFISPSPDGGIDLEWQSESGSEFMLEIPPSGARMLLYTRIGDVESESTIENLSALDLLRGGAKV